LDESGVKRIEYVQFKKLPNSQRYQQTESKESFADIYNVYNINLTSTMVLLKFLEPAVKYKVLVRAISFKTRSDPVFKEDFTSEYIYQTQYMISVIDVQTVIANTRQYCFLVLKVNQAFQVCMLAVLILQELYYLELLIK